MANTPYPSKVYLVTRDISNLNGTALEKKVDIPDSDIYKILDYNVEIHRSLNKDGVPYMSLNFGTIQFTIDGTEHETNKALYSALKSNSPVTFSMIYGVRDSTHQYREAVDAKEPAYGISHQFRKYDDSFVFDSYVTDIEEVFENDPQTGEGLLKLNIEFLVLDGKFLHDKNA